MEHSLAQSLLAARVRAFEAWLLNKVLEQFDTLATDYEKNNSYHVGYCHPDDIQWTVMYPIGKLSNQIIEWIMAGFQEFNVRGYVHVWVNRPTCKCNVSLDMSYDPLHGGNKQQ